jgi:hypothetical protein
VIEGLNTLLAVVGADDDAALKAHATHYFGIAPGANEALSPLLTSMPAELLACHLAYLHDERFFRADGRGTGIGRGRITESHILRQAADL